MTPAVTETARPIPEFPQTLGHPRPLWMLFMTEFWERFAFYGMRWALTLYIVAQFFNHDQAGQAYASRTYGAYLALVYASAIFGGYVADRILGYQRSILVGAAVMGTGLFMVMMPNQQIFLAGLATVIVGNGLFKPNISSLVGQIYAPGDDRRDRGFTIFYMGINGGGLVAPLITGWLASVLSNTPMEQNYKVVFAASGVGMIFSLIWFWIGKHQMKGIGVPPPERNEAKSLLMVVVGIVVAIPLVYLLMAKAGAIVIAWLLGALFIGVGVMLVVEAIRHGKVQIHRVIAMLLLFAFNVTFWMFFEQAGSSFNFLAENIVNRNMFDGAFVFPTGWFQSVNSAAILICAPLVALAWAWSSRIGREPSIPRKFGLGLIFNALAFLVLMYALTKTVDSNGQIPFWPLALCYVMQTLGELCLSPIGLSMVTKLAPSKVVGLAMGGWFLSTAIGNNLSGLLAGHISGENGMTVQSALDGFTFSFWLLLGAGVALFLIAPLINKLMHGVK
ncbi:POT family proton-dependent oligopeptide transporter [Luteibacter rhizovicinus]|uniref:POT family proton-dependent oligopeptide transporter n=1 Tax=Luteibacter rhizovicinus TaxID=242606 RepID=A0A4R3YTH2_9GAMM|nr:peptide MFS transporter [Luteibacter rhizovicinus]TCV95800.1 POT family proton-dependent oligopeptide transporter [Luteibacter rhizovicinus]